MGHGQDQHQSGSWTGSWPGSAPARISTSQDQAFTQPLTLILALTRTLTLTLTLTLRSSYDLAFTYAGISPTRHSVSLMKVPLRFGPRVRIGQFLEKTHSRFNIGDKWDGLDAAGRAHDDKARVRVAIGVTLELR